MREQPTGRTTSAWPTHPTPNHSLVQAAGQTLSMFLAYAVLVWMFSPNLVWVLLLTFGPAALTWVRRGFSGRW
jgi:hypothetical protein